MVSARLNPLAWFCNKILAAFKAAKLRIGLNCIIGSTVLSLLNWDFPYGFLPTTSVGLFCDSLPAPQIGKAFFGSPSIFLWHRGCFGAFLARMPCFSRMRRHLLRGFQYSPAMVESLPS